MLFKTKGQLDAERNQLPTKCCEISVLEESYATEIRSYVCEIKNFSHVRMHQADVTCKQFISSHAILTAVIFH